MNTEHLYSKAVALLNQLIAIPSFSKEEQGTARLLQNWLMKEGINVHRKSNNVIAFNKYFDKSNPTVLLNSHHDTVRPATGYSHDPFVSFEDEGKLFGLGSNDAGGCLVSLAHTFLHFYDQPLPFNLVFAATAEEEISGMNGIASVLPLIGKIDCAVVGEPTGMQMAVAERGLMVLDAVSTGVSGHAARQEGDNALYKAMKDIEWFRTYIFEKTSDMLGPVSMQVTAIETENKAHNVIPDHCRFVVDLRLNECYSPEDVLETIRANVQSQVKPRSTRLRSSIITADHPLVIAGKALGWNQFGSPTLSDKALMPFPALKIGPGDSARSHIADEYIFLDEVRQGIEGYVNLLQHFGKQLQTKHYEDLAKA